MDIDERSLVRMTGSVWIVFAGSLLDTSPLQQHPVISTHTSKHDAVAAGLAAEATGYYASVSIVGDPVVFEFKRGPD